MASIKEIVLPGGWTEQNGGFMGDFTLLGRKGNRAIQDNDPFYTWAFNVVYKRSDAEEEAGARFEQIYNFFLVSKGFGFLVDDAFDNTASARGGAGIVKSEGGVYRLFKRYTSNGISYDHPITRPREDVVLGGGAAGKTLDLGTGIVTNGTAPGTWTGSFYRPMLCPDGGLQFRRTPDGMVESIGIQLEEQIEL